MHYVQAINPLLSHARRVIPTTTRNFTHQASSWSYSLVSWHTSPVTDRADIVCLRMTLTADATKDAAREDNNHDDRRATQNKQQQRQRPSRPAPRARPSSAARRVAYTADTQRRWLARWRTHAAGARRLEHSRGPRARPHLLIIRFTIHVRALCRLTP